jgi:putative transposase
MIIGTHGEKLEHIMRDMKKHTSVKLKQAIQQHPGESRKEWMLWMMERAGKKNGQNINFQLWQQDNHPIELISYQMVHQKLDYSR